jgi:hypothetical protein
VSRKINLILFVAVLVGVVLFVYYWVNQERVHFPAEYAIKNQETSIYLLADNGVLRQSVGDSSVLDSALFLPYIVAVEFAKRRLLEIRKNETDSLLLLKSNFVFDALPALGNLSTKLNIDVMASFGSPENQKNTLYSINLLEFLSRLNKRNLKTKINWDVLVELVELKTGIYEDFEHISILKIADINTSETWVLAYGKHINCHERELIYKVVGLNSLQAKWLNQNLEQFVLNSLTCDTY